MEFKNVNLSLQNCQRLTDSALKRELILAKSDIDYIFI